MSFMSNARSTNSSKVLYFAHRKATSKPEKPSRSKENGAVLYFAHGVGKSGCEERKIEEERTTTAPF